MLLSKLPYKGQNSYHSVGYVKVNQMLTSNILVFHSKFRFKQ